MNIVYAKFNLFSLKLYVDGIHKYCENIDRMSNITSEFNDI